MPEYGWTGRGELPAGQHLTAESLSVMREMLLAVLHHWGLRDVQDEVFEQVGPDRQPIDLPPALTES